MTDKIAILAARLRSPRPASAIIALQQWAEGKSYAQCLDLLRACSDADRTVLASALREVLSGYPARWGLPVLMRYSGREDWLELPISATPPVPQALEWHWESASLAPAAPAGILPNRIQCAIFVIRTSAHETPEVPDAYWQDLFDSLSSGDEIRISARIALPYLDSIEAAMALKAVATSGGVPLGQQRQFLNDHAWQWALEAGQRFRHFVNS